MTSPKISASEKAVIAAAESTSAAQQKSQIFFHRSYRIIAKQSKMYYFLLFLLLAVAPGIIIFLYLPEITLLLSQLSKTVLSTAFAEEFIHIKAEPFFGQQVYFLSTPGRYPHFDFSVAIALISLIVILITPRIRWISRPVAIWIMIFCFMNLISSAFFMLVPNWFPYGVETFSIVYIKTEASMWLMIPVILAISVLFFPSGISGKIALVVAAVGYDIVFTLLRYIVFLYLLQEATFLFMAIMFFLFGPLLDFIYIVGFYALYLNKISRPEREGVYQWKWLY